MIFHKASNIWNLTRKQNVRQTTPDLFLQHFSVPGCVHSSFKFRKFPNPTCGSLVELTLGNSDPKLSKFHLNVLQIAQTQSASLSGQKFPTESKCSQCMTSSDALSLEIFPLRVSKLDRNSSYLLLKLYNKCSHVFKKGDKLIKQHSRCSDTWLDQSNDLWERWKNVISVVVYLNL